MKTAFSTLSCMDKTPSQVSDLARRHGFDAVEIRLDGNGAFNGLSDPRIFRDLFSGIGILSFNTGITVTPDADVIEELKKTASFAASCGAGGIRIFADPCCEVRSIAGAIAESSAVANREGVKLLIETHGELTSTPDMRSLIELTDGSFGVIWDVLHTLETGEPIAESATNLNGAIAHVHLKDAVKTGGGYRMTKLGEGDVDPTSVREFIDGDVPLSLEWEEFWHEELRGIYRSSDDLLDSYLDWLK